MKKISAKAETAGGHINIMELYCEPVGEINLEELKYLCDVRRRNYEFIQFYYLVVFDSEENAKFPETPFSAMFADEEDTLKHIKAIYTYNVLNGYSVLDVYEKNKWDSPAEEIRI